MADQETATDETKKELAEGAKLPYTDKEGKVNEPDMLFARKTITQINKDLEARETASIVFNGIPYSEAYVYNMRKGVNYSPPKSQTDDRQVSMGLVHEKIVGFAAIFLKYVFKRRVKCYDDKGNLVRGMGEIYSLAIELSRRLEQFKTLLALIFWEVFTQGDAWILEDWEVRTFPTRDAYKGDVKLSDDDIDYTYEFLEGLNWKEGETIQTRKAKARLLDGRQVILGNPEIENVQDQPRITIEEELSDEDAEALFATLARWAQVPKEATTINLVTGMEKSTLFDMKRLPDPKKKKLLHRFFSKEDNRFNVFLNGVMLLPKDTPLDFFYPRGNYPLTGIHGERLKGSAYSRSVPAKTKFNADYVDWVLKNIALKFEQGMTPAILAKGKYTLTRDMFKAGQVTHGVSKQDFDKADPDNKGVTASEFSFVKLIKEIMEGQTLNSTTTGEVSDQSTATAVNQAQANQGEKLGYLLDGITNGFMDLDLRRAETIESKYTIAQKETIVDGKKVKVYQNFTVTMDGVEHQVAFDDNVGSETYDVQSKKDELFNKSFKQKKAGTPTEYYLVNPSKLRYEQYGLDIEIHPERVKDTQSLMISMWDEFIQLKNVFGGAVSQPELQKIYLEVSGRPDTLFLPEDIAKLNEAAAMAGAEGGAPYNAGSMGKGMKPQIKASAMAGARGR